MSASAAAGVTPAVNSVATPTAAWALPTASDLAVWLYLLPLVVLLLTMVVAVVRLGAMHRRANVLVNPSWQAALAMAQRRMGFKHGTALLVSEELRSPVSWGVMRPIILLNPAAISASAEAEAIIAHELAHVARLDWAKLLVARAACALLWFNPLVWRLAREAHQLREEAADDAVLMSEVDGADYAALLVNAARHDNQGLLIAAHGVAPGKDSLKRRISRVLDGNLSRRPATAAWSFLCLGVLIGLAAPLAAFDPFSIRADAAVQTSPLAPVAVAGVAAATAPPLPAALVTGPQPVGAVAALKRPLTPEELIQMRAVGVSRRDIEALRAAGVEPLTADEAIQARAVGITPEYAAGIAKAFPQARFDDIVAARAVGIDPSEALAMRRAWPSASLDDLTAAKATGVTADYVAGMRRVFPNVDIDDLTAMRATGVDPAFVREMQRAFHGRVTPEQAIEARAVGLGNVAESVRHATREARKAARSVQIGTDIDVDVDPDPDPED
jgi:beta-lactamase regulating signal transducer with metallopeptidase domain